MQSYRFTMRLGRVGMVSAIYIPLLCFYVRFEGLGDNKVQIEWQFEKCVLLFSICICGANLCFHNEVKISENLRMDPLKKIEKSQIGPITIFRKLLVSTPSWFWLPYWIFRVDNNLKAFFSVQSTILCCKTK